MEKSEPKQYNAFELLEKDLDPDPFKQFGFWFDAAQDAGLVHPDAFALATVSEEGRPSARMLLLKGFDESGFVFYTNSESRKGEELHGNSNAAICFWWDKLERQVRIEGKVERVPGEEADLYFSTRPRGSRLGAWASRQSRVLTSRDVLETRVAECAERFKGAPVPRPPFWSGFRLVPERIEFWTGRPSRLHDREVFERDGAGWRVSVLSP